MALQEDYKYCEEIIRENSKSFFKARGLDKPIFRAFKDTFSKLDLDIEPFYHMLEGQKRDYKFSQPENIEEFKDYCYHVAGSVGLMLLPIIATENKEELKNVATGLGEAMQITNILRDVGEGYREGYTY